MYANRRGIRFIDTFVPIVFIIAPILHSCAIYMEILSLPNIFLYYSGVFAILMYDIIIIISLLNEFLNYP